MLREATNCGATGGLRKTAVSPATGELVCERTCDRLFGVKKARARVGMDVSLGFGRDLFDHPRYHQLSAAPRTGRLSYKGR